jgi:hypothetical protein
MTSGGRETGYSATSRGEMHPMDWLVGLDWVEQLKYDSGPRGAIWLEM